jgi:hypothetical protein
MKRGLSVSKRSPTGSGKGTKREKFRLFSRKLLAQTLFYDPVFYGPVFYGPVFPDTACSGILNMGGTANLQTALLCGDWIEKREASICL